MTDLPLCRVARIVVLHGAQSALLVRCRTTDGVDLHRFGHYRVEASKRGKLTAGRNEPLQPTSGAGATGQSTGL